MMTIKFSDPETEKKALGFLLGRFSGRLFRSGKDTLHILPDSALEALKEQNIPFTLVGKATYEQQVAALRGASAPTVQ